MVRSMITYVVKKMHTVTSHGIDRMQVILIIKTVKMISRVALAWSVKLFLNKISHATSPSYRTTCLLLLYQPSTLSTHKIV